MKHSVRIWSFVTLLLVVALVGVLLFQFNPTFRSNVSGIFEKEEVVTQEVMENVDSPSLGLTVIHNPEFKGDESMPTVEKLVEILQNEVPANLNVSMIDFSSEEGAAMIKKLQLKTLPAFVFDEDLENYPQLEKIRNFSLPREGKFLFRSKPFEHLETPTFGDGSVRGGDAKKAPHKIVFYCSFSIEECSEAAELMKTVAQKFPEKVAIAYKYFDAGYFDIPVVNAAECAGVQGSFFPFVDMFYSQLREISEENMQMMFARFQAKLGLDQKKFTTCLEAQEYEQKVLHHTFEAYAFGVSSAPTLFIDGKYTPYLPKMEEFEEMFSE